MSDKIYFNNETQKAIVEYNLCGDAILREKIYQEQIEPAFYKLTECIINRFKFEYSGIEFKSLQQDVISYLVLKMNTYKEDKGKAFSYFSVIAKNYLVILNKGNYKEWNRTVEPDEVDLVYTTTEHGTDVELLLLHVKSYLTDNVDLLFGNKEDRRCLAKEVINLLDDEEFMNSLKINSGNAKRHSNKSQVYEELVKRTGIKYNTILKTFKVLKRHYKKAKTEYFLN